MKKTLLILAAALFSATAFSQTVTKINADGSNNTFKLPKDSHVYAFFKLSDGVKQKLGIDDAHYTYIGEEPSEGRNLWNWRSDAQNPGGPKDATGKDSFSETGQYFDMQGADGWSGWGLNVDAKHPIDLSKMYDSNSDDAETKAGLYFAVRQTHRSIGSTPTITITDGDGNEGKFVLGKTTGLKSDELGLNIPADGNWYSVTISAYDLLDLVGVDFSTPANKTYSDKNLFTFAWAGAPDDFGLDYAAFIYGPGEPTTGISEIKTDKAADANAPIYNLAGQRVSNPTHGIFIQNGKKFIKK